MFEGRTWTSLLLGLQFVGCAEAERTWLPAQAHRAVLVFRERAERAELHVRAIDEGGAIELEVLEGDELLVLQYLASLEELRLEEGDLKRPANGRRSPRPDAASIWTGDGLSAVDPSTLDLEDLHIPWLNDDPCYDIQLEREFELPGTSAAGKVLVLPFASDRALVVASSGQFFELDGQLQLRHLFTDPQFPAYAGYGRRDTGEVWLTSRDGRVTHGHPDRGLELGPTRTSTRGELEVWLDGARDGAPTELFSVGRPGVFERFDGQRWSRIDDATTTSAEGVIWVGPGHGIAGGIPSDSMAHFENGTTLHWPLPLVPGASLKSLQWVEGWGPMVGTVSGDLFRWDGELWLPLPPGPVGSRVFGILPREQGLIYGGERGSLQQYVQEHGHCEGAALISFDLSQLVYFPGRIVGCGGAGFGRDLRCAVFRW